MTCDIIRFPEKTITLSFEPDECQPSREQDEERLKRIAARTRLVENVRAAAQSGEPFPRRHDRIWPAQEIDRLIRHEGVRPRDVLRILAENGEGKVHLERVRLDHTLRPEHARRHQKKRSIRVQPYVVVLDAIAHLLGERPDDLISFAFGWTSYGEAAVREDGGEAVEVAHLLRAMCNEVIRAEDLRAVFRQAREVPGEYDPVTGDLERGDRPLISALHMYPPEMREAGYEGGGLPSWTQPPFPAVPLARVRRAAFEGPLLVERKIFAPSECGVIQVARMLAGYSEGRALGSSDAIPAEVRYHTDVRLAIGPTINMNRIGPLFEVRSHVELLTDGKERPLTFPLTLFRLGERGDSGDRFLTSVAARFDDGWRLIGGFGTQAWTGDEELDTELFGRGWDTGPCLQSIIGSDRKYEYSAYWEPVDASTTGQLMQLYRRSDCQPLPFGAAYGERPFRFRNEKVLDLLFERLLERSRELKGAVDAHARDLLMREDEGIEAMLKRWRSIGRTPNDSD